MAPAPPSANVDKQDRVLGGKPKGPGGQTKQLMMCEDAPTGIPRSTQDMHETKLHACLKTPFAGPKRTPKSTHQPSALSKQGNRKLRLLRSCEVLATEYTKQPAAGLAAPTKAHVIGRGPIAATSTRWLAS